MINLLKFNGELVSNTLAAIVTGCKYWELFGRNIHLLSPFVVIII